MNAAGGGGDAADFWRDSNVGDGPSASGILWGFFGDSLGWSVWELTFCWGFFLWTGGYECETDLLFDVTNEAIEWRSGCRGGPNSTDASDAAAAAATTVEFHRCEIHLCCAALVQPRFAATFEHLRLKMKKKKKKKKSNKSIESQWMSSWPICNNETRFLWMERRGEGSTRYLSWRDRYPYSKKLQKSE